MSKEACRKPEWGIYRIVRIGLTILFIGSLASIATATQSKGVKKMRADLIALWDMTKIRQTPLDVKIVSSHIEDGVRVEEVYFSSEMTEKGPHRIFCGVARPENPAKPIPVLLEMHGGGGHGSAERAAWMAKNTGALAISLDWGGAVPPGPKEHTNWATYPDGQGLPSLGPQAGTHRVVTAARRAIDYAATQPHVDMSTVVIYGGSWGSFHSVIAAGVDERITGLIAIAGAGSWRNSYSICAYGIQLMPPAQRQEWLRTYDPVVYAPYTTADSTFIMYANDGFFFYDSIQRNFKALPEPKRLITTPNNDHSIGGHPEAVGTWPAAMPVLRHHLYHDGVFPEVVTRSLRSHENSYTWRATDNTTQAFLYFSPGKGQWRSRYWVEIPAHKEGKGWRADLPEMLSGVAGEAYVTVFDGKGGATSTMTRSRRGTDPRVASCTLWKGQNIWDTGCGKLAWRPSVYHKFTRIDDDLAGSIRVTSVKDDPHFLVLTDSAVLASGMANAARGVLVRLNGLGKAGTCTVQLWRDGPRQNKQTVYSATIEYSATETTVEIPWDQFKGPDGASNEVWPFDTLALEGDRSADAPLRVGRIEFMH